MPPLDGASVARRGDRRAGIIIIFDLWVISGSMRIHWQKERGKYPCCTLFRVCTKGTKIVFKNIIYIHTSNKKAKKEIESKIKNMSKKLATTTWKGSVFMFWSIFQFSSRRLVASILSISSQFSTSNFFLF